MKKTGLNKDNLESYVSQGLPWPQNAPLGWDTGDIFKLPWW